MEKGGRVPRRYVLTGVPGSGKTALLSALRRRGPVPDTVGVQLYDRSPLCTLALARYLGRPIMPLLAQEVNRVLCEQVYEAAVFLIRPLGFIEPTAARRITYADSLPFEQVHEAVYQEHGFELVDVPASSRSHRVAVVEAHLAAEGK